MLTSVMNIALKNKLMWKSFLNQRDLQKANSDTINLNLANFDYDHSPWIW